MQLTSALVLASVLGGQALGALNCTVAAPSLTKRLCESDSCPVYARVASGSEVLAACRADCSTDEEPWLKLYDGTFVRASSSELSGCRNFCQPYSIMGLPKCHELAGASRPPSCSASSLKSRAAISNQPTPLGAPPAPLPAIAALCNMTLSAADMPPPTFQKRTVLSRLFSRNRYYANNTFTARGVNTTLSARSVPLNWNSSSIGSARVHARWVAPRNTTLPVLEQRGAVNVNTTLGVHHNLWQRGEKAMNATLAARAPWVNTTSSGTGAKVEARFVNGTFVSRRSVEGGRGRTPPVVTKPRFTV